MGHRERRSQPRLQTRHSASVSAMGVAVLGEIRDFCRGGLYLAFADARTAQAVAAWRVRTHVEVSFTAVIDGRPQRHRMTGTVAHTSPGGLGLQVTTIAEGALRALQVVGQAVPPQPVTSADDPQHLGLQQRCRQLHGEFLDVLLMEFFDAVGGKLEAAGEKAATAREQKLFREAPWALSSQRARIQATFLAGVLEHFDPQRPPPSTFTPDDEFGGLALLDEAELEDWLSLTSVVNQIEMEGGFGRALASVERRYGELVGRTLDRQSNPFGPAVICRSFQASTRDLQLCKATRAVAYQTFGDILARHLPALCEKLDAVLSATPARQSPAAFAGPPPASTHKPPGLPTSPTLPVPQAGHMAVTASPVAPAFEPEPQPERLQRMMAAPLPQGMPDALDSGLDRLLSGLNRGSGSAPSSEQLPRGSRPAGPAQVAAGLVELEGGMRRADGGAAGRVAHAGVAGGQPPNPASLDDLLRAIDARPSAGWTGRAGPAGLPLSERMAQAVEGLSIPGPFRQVLDTAGSVFGHAIAQSGGGSAIDAMLMRLEQPLLKRSLQDGGFPDTPDDPARQVVDLIEQFAIAADDQGQFFDAKLQRFLEAAVERVCAQSDHDPGVFLSTRDSLSRLLAPIRHARQSRIARLQEACEARQGVLCAREAVRQALDVRLAGRPVPKVVLALLDAGWRQYLVLQAMRAGIDGQGFAQALAALDRLLALLQVEQAPASTLVCQEAAALCDRIEQQLASANLDGDQRNAIVATLVRDVDAALREGRVPDSVRVTRAARSAAAASEPVPAHATLLKRLRVGDWWHFLEAGRWLPMQLIWLAGPAGDCAFANRSATQKIDLSLAEFDKRLREGSARAWADQDRPLLERSVHAMLDDGSQRIQQRATHDPVTGLLSRKGFLQRLAQAARQSPSQRAHILGVVEFDQFRVVYQACGAEEGEALSRALADEVRAAIGTDGVLASFRDDTLALFLPACGRDQGLALVDGLLGRLRDYRHQAGEHSFSIGASVGVAEYDPGQLNPEAAVQQADMACVAAKTLGRNRFQFYEPDNQQLQTQRSMIDLTGRLDSLLAGSGLYLRGQMIMPIGADASLMPYHEVLLGIDGARGQPIKPLPFILGVERLHRAHEVDLWVLRRVFDWIRDNPSGFEAVGGLSINLSTMSLANAEVIGYLHETLSRDDIPAGRISFEITETAAIECYAAAGDFIRQMRRYGCKFALDDFGSGHTSYAHLKNLRADALKIDGSFVRDIVDSPSDYAIVKSMNDIAHSLGMVTVAEYVESPAILAKLREIGVDYAQGFAIHKPCPIDQIVALEPA